ncbi:hypothetical protein [Streptomyces sp. bgisy095]|uniref:hypothetical protein n=1 Tax=unclassified Streptomyces TaxID=2593676 RepID=UPI003D7200BD
MMDVRLIKRGQMYRYYLRQVVVGDYLRPVRTPLGIAQVQVGVPPGRWTGRGLAELADCPDERVAVGVERRQLGLLPPGALVAPDQLDRS